MPADRSRTHTVRRGEESQQLVWTVPVEAATVDAEGPAILSSPAAVDFDDGPPPLIDRDLIFCPGDGDLVLPPRKTPHSKKKPDDHIPRPPNAFILFRSAFIRGQHVPTEVETNHSTLSKIIGLTWKNLPNEERMFWHAKAKVALDEHKRKFPQYSFRPTISKVKAPGGKRKVREVGPKDPVRCAKIAQLLVEGKKGQELDAAIQEFDKHHVPQVVTRFEKPLTARMYLRSASAPAPDADVEGEEPRKLKKVRSASTQPGTPIAPSTTPAVLQTSQTLPQPQLVDCLQPPQPSFTASFEQFTLPAQPSSTFEQHPAFCFDPPAATYCEMTPIQTNNLLFQENVIGVNNTPLSSPTVSINESYLTAEDWNPGCSSPVSSPSSVSCSSPATPPSYMESPCPTFTPFTLDSLESSLAKSFGSSNFAAYDYEYDYGAQEHGATVTAVGAGNGSCFAAYEQFPEPSFASVTAQTQIATDAELDFSAFVRGIPQYAL